MAIYNWGYNHIGYQSRGAGVAFPPFKSNLALDFWKRPLGSLTLLERPNGNDAAVVGGYWGLFDSDSDIPLGNLFDLGANDFFISATINTSNLTASQYVVRYDGFPSDAIAFWVNNSKIKLSLYNGTTFSAEFDILQDTTYDVMGKLEGGFIKIYVDGDLKDSLDVSSETFNFNSSSDWHIGGVGTGTNFEGNMCCVNINDQAVYHLNNNTYNSITGLEATNNGVTFELLNTETPASTLIALDSGFYQNIADKTIQVIDPQYALPGSGWEAFSGGKFHNFIQSSINFNPTASGDSIYDILDRSNATIYNATARTDDYDAGNPWTFRIDKVHYDVIQSMLNPAYQGRVFEQLKTNYGTILQASELAVYADQKTGDDLIKVLNWANYNYIAEGYEALFDSEGVPLYDSEGKILTVPIT